MGRGASKLGNLSARYPRLGRTAGRPWVAFLIVWFAFSSISIAWAIATPLGASPDEPAHIVKAASVARGEFVGAATDEPAVTRVEVPAGLAQAKGWTCYAFNSTVEASCVPDIKDVKGSATATTSAGLYNPTYYALVGWPSLLTEDTSRAVVLMRVVSAVLVSFFFAVAAHALLRLRRDLLTGTAILAAATPMCFFLAGAVNPNALEVSTGAALTASLLLVVRQWDRIRLPLWLGAVAVSGGLLAQARGLSPLWMAVIAVAVLVGSQPRTLATLMRRLDVWITILVLAAGVGAAAAWLLYTGTLASMGEFPGAGDVTPRQAFVTMLVDRSFDPGIIGFFGWLDTPAPTFAYVWWSFLAAGMAVAALVLGRGRALLGFGVALAGFFLVPAVTQALSVTSSGYIWQGRYTLVGYVVAIVFAVFAVTPSAPVSGLRPGVHRRAAVVLGSLTIAAHAFTFLVAIKRYAVGLDASWGAFLAAPQWLPPLGQWPWLLLLLVGATAMVAYVFGAAAPGRSAAALSLSREDVATSL